MTDDKTVLSLKVETLNAQLNQLQEERETQIKEFESKLKDSEATRVAAEENYRRENDAREAEFKQQKEDVLSSIEGLQKQNSYKKNQALGFVAVTAKSLEFFSSNGHSMKRY